jgi:ubiquitin-conjugating enzyme E2 H
MANIFEVFLPQLLAYPNVGDPLNAEAAHLMQGEPTLYEAKVKEYVKRFASREIATGESHDGKNGAEEEEEEDHVMSDVSLSDVEDAARDMDL